MLKKFVLLVIVLCAIAAGGFVYVKNSVETFITQPLNIEQSELVTVQRGNSLNTIIGKFVANQWIEPTDFESLIRRFHPELTQIKVGTFELKPGMNFEQAINEIIQGQEYQLAITFIEGSTFKEWRQQFAIAEHLEHATEEMTEVEIAKALVLNMKSLKACSLQKRITIRLVIAIWIS